VEEINARGGINGHPVSLFIRDGKTSEETILAADRELAGLGIHALIGHTTSAETIIAYPYVMAQGIVMLAPYTASNNLARRDDLLFRTQVDNRQYAQAFARLFQREGLRRLTVLLDNSNLSFCSDLMENIAEVHGGELLPVWLDSTLDTSWNRVIQTIQDTGTDGTLLITEARTTAIALQKLRQYGNRGPVFATIWAQSPSLFSLGGAEVQDLILVSFLSPAHGGEDYHQIDEVSRQRFGHPTNGRSIRAYEAVHILAQAMTAVPYPPKATQIKEQLLRGSFSSPLGTVNFDQYGDVRRPIYEIGIEQNRFVRRGIVIPGPDDASSGTPSP